MQSNSPRHLQASPTAATLNPYRSSSSLNNDIPPLVSINDKSASNGNNINKVGNNTHTHANRSINNNTNTRTHTHTTTQNRYNNNNNNNKDKDKDKDMDIDGQPITHSTFTNGNKNTIAHKKSKRQEANTKIQRNANTNANTNANFNAKNMNMNKNASKYLYSTKANRKPSIHANTNTHNNNNNNNNAHTLNTHNSYNKMMIEGEQDGNRQQEQSIAQSVYLDLEEYSSIHKYESGSPYDLEEEDRDYVKYFINNRNSYHSNTHKDINANINIIRDIDGNVNREKDKGGISISNFTLQEQSVAKTSTIGNNRRHQPNIDNYNDNYNNNYNNNYNYNNTNAYAYDRMPKLINSRLVNQQPTPPSHSHQPSPLPSGLPQPKLDLNDTYNQFLTEIEMGEQQPQLRVRRVQSSNAEIIKPITHGRHQQHLLIQDKHNTNMNMNTNMNTNMKMNMNSGNGQMYKTWVSQQIEIEQKDKHSAEFNRIEESDSIAEHNHSPKNNKNNNNKNRDRDRNGDNYYEVAKQLYQHYFRQGYNNNNNNEQSISDGEGLSNRKQYSDNYDDGHPHTAANLYNAIHKHNTIHNTNNPNTTQPLPLPLPLPPNPTPTPTLAQMQSPEWICHKSAQNILRLILIKKHRLDQFINYNRQLQIYFKYLYHSEQLNKLCDRHDVNINSQHLKYGQGQGQGLNQDKPSHIKVYYDIQPQYTYNYNHKQSKQSNYGKDSKYKTQGNQINYYSEELPQTQMEKAKKQSMALNKPNINHPFSAAYSTISVKSQTQSKQGHKAKGMQLAGSGVGSSDYVTSLNVFGLNKNNRKDKQKDININININRDRQRRELYSIYSQMDGQSNYNQSAAVARKPMLTKMGRLKNIEILQILEILLVKLSDKKCNVFVKEPSAIDTVVNVQNISKQKQKQKQKQRQRQRQENKRDIYNSNSNNNNNNYNNKVTASNKLQNMALSSVSKQSMANRYSLNFNINTNMNTNSNEGMNKNKGKFDGDISNMNNNQKITKIQFQQYTHTHQNTHHGHDLNKSPIKPNTHPSEPQQHASCSKKLQTYSQRIKQLNAILEQKDKYIEEVKAQYDYVINNYINSIANLKNMQQIDPSILPTVLRGLSTNSQGGGERGGGRTGDKYNKQKYGNEQEQEQSDQQKKQKEQDSQEQDYEENKYGRPKGRNKGLDMSDEEEENQVAVKRRQQINRQKRQKQRERERERERERGAEQPLQNIRLSQPMTFQMSMAGNDNSREQQWIGHPGNPQPETQPQNTGDNPGIRRSSMPSKQDQLIIKHHKSKQHLLF